MRILYLLRHAKSSWEDDSVPDFDRPLKKRGRKAAAAVGKKLASEELSDPILISSPAARTRETTAILLQNGLDADVNYDERIYNADLQQLLAVIADVDAKRKQVILVGHNPGMEYLLEFLTGSSQRMPTAALARISSKKSSWQLGKGEGKLEWLVTPDELND